MSMVRDEERRDTTLDATFHPKSWDMVGSVEFAHQLPTGEVLADLADERGDIVVCTADLGRPTRVHPFKLRHPDRYVNFGLAERNMISAAAGMAVSGLRPFVSGYGAFLGIIGAEQIRTDVGYPNAPVRLIGTHSGVAMGFYGTSHHATEDISMLRPIAELALLSAADGTILTELIRETVDHDGPLYIRTGRGREPRVYEEPPQVRIGGSSQLRTGRDALVVATGACVRPAVDAADALAEQGHRVGVIDAYSLKPFDGEGVAAAAGDASVVVTVEEHNVVGGLGSIVRDELHEQGVTTPVVKLGLPDEYSLLGPPTHLYAHYGIGRDGIVTAVSEALG